MVKCAICGNTVGIVFLDKIKGTHVRKDGRMHAVCSECQQAHRDDLREKI